MEVQASLYYDGGGGAKAKCLLDTGSQLNLVRKEFAFVNGFLPISRALPCAYSVKGRDIPLTAKFLLTLQVRDDIGEERTID